MKKSHSKRFKKLLEESKEKKSIKIEDVINKVKKNCTTKFDESIDVSFLLNLKQKKDEFNLRTVVNLPNGNGKKVKVAVLCEENKVSEAKGAGAELNEEEELKILTRLQKQRKDSLAIYEEQNREDLASEERAQLEVIEEFLPKALSPEELEDYLKKLIAEVGAAGPQDMGKVMGRASKDLAGRADGKSISTKVKELLAN